MKVLWKISGEGAEGKRLIRAGSHNFVGKVALFDSLLMGEFDTVRVFGRESVEIHLPLGYDNESDQDGDDEAEDTTLMNKQKKISESRKYHIY